MIDRSGKNIVRGKLTHYDIRIYDYETMNISFKLADYEMFIKITFYETIFLCPFL